MRSLSFITRYSPIYRSALVEIHVDDKPIAAAIPLEPSKKDLEKDRNKMGKFSDELTGELTKEEYGLADYEIQAILEYLTTSELFQDFTYDKIVKADEKVA